MARAKRFVQNNNTNAIVYARYSSAAQRDVSIEQQLEEAERYCKARGYHIIQRYVDRAITGTTDNRPEFQLMLTEVERLRPGYLIIWKTDRLSRDRLDGALAKKRMRDCGVKIEYVAEPMPEDEAERALIEGIEEAIAEHFIIQHSKNVSRGLGYNAEKAWYNGHQIFGYVGKKNQRYEIDPKTGPAVTRIFNDYADGKPMKVIANELNAAGFTTTKGKPFTEKTLWHTFHNRSYIGEYKWGDILIPDGFPQLVAPEIFEKCQDMMQKNKHGGRGASRKLHQDDPLAGIDFWLTGSLYCGECGAPMSGTSGTSKHGNLYYYYACAKHKRHECDNKNVPKHAIERVVASVLSDCINDPTLRIAIAERVYGYYQREYGRDENYATAIKNNIKSVDEKLNNIMRAIEAGIFNETTQERMQELQTQKKAYEDELAAENNRKKYSLKPEHVVRYLECFIGNLDEPSLRDRVLSYLVDKIYVYKDKLVVSFYYSDDKREVNIQDLNAVLDNQDEILRMLNEHEHTTEKKYQDAVAKMIESLENVSDEGTDFFG